MGNSRAKATLREEDRGEGITSGDRGKYEGKEDEERIWSRTKRVLNQ